ncbi:MAG TPA: mucoidy inhibitor MuiA family protein, partial [Kofleriaceae bacterium]|nr:mucoidy inhibitor MuiA family protein [Kofleriaceae bacterium]
MASFEAVLAQVTVYANGARVRRVTTVNSGLSHVRIVDLPISVIDDTVRVEVTGAAIATAVRVAVDAPAVDSAASEETPEVRGAQRAVALAETEVERLDAALARLAGARVVEEDASDDAPPPWAQVVAARRTIVALRAERELAVREQLARARHQLDGAQRALVAARDRDERGGSARPAKLHELRKHVDIELVATDPRGGEATLWLEYQVGAARWAPSYVARLDGDEARIEVRAVVAQDTGEDWTAVPLRLSTAEPERFAPLPELHAQRIGRRQAEPRKPGFRPPPIGAQALYTDYERGPRGAPERLVPEPDDEPFGGATDEHRGDEPLPPQSGFAIDTRQMAPPAPMPGAAPEMFGAAPMRQMMKKSLVVGAEGSGSAGSNHEPRESTPRLDYGNLRMAPPTSPSRGTLVPARREPHARQIDRDVTSVHARLVSLPLPPGCSAAWTHAYDYAFTTDGTVDVKADGAWHSIAVTASSSPSKLRHVSVPREQADVFRLATITNPFVGPLLPGPIDVYDRGRFLVTSELDYTPSGATVDIGLGVDAAVKIARNTEFREEATGVLRGALRLHHAITIDVENLSGRGIEIEVRERLPVTREGDDDVEVT